jgi:hypothetical protein
VTKCVHEGWGGEGGGVSERERERERERDEESEAGRLTARDNSSPNGINNVWARINNASHKYA